jgi:uncharacterized protein (TIGR02680 family)
MSIKNRWTITRIGLINFWYYDEQEFEFSDGKLLLRGSNGSGKSVTMQSFIPLLFDGNKSPERLDPFGSRARKLENYLLGEDEHNKEENTGYLYMEFIKPESENYLTIGMGLRAKRGRTVDFWGFSITDGRRIGLDLLLYKNIGEKIPLSRIELRNRIGDGGEVLESQRGYMEMVNKHLFGYEDIDEYDELIKLLVQIRTPKLSKEFKPTVIYEIMNNSLQPLSDDDLRPLSEAIENMDKIRDQLEMLKESKKAADRLKAEYNKYNRFILLEKARDYSNASHRLDNARKEAEEQRKQSIEYLEMHKKAEEERQNLIQLQESLEHKKQQLEEHDGFKAKQEIVKLEALLKELETKKEAKEYALGQKRDRENRLNIKINEAIEQKDEQEESIDELLKEMGELAEEVFFDEHHFSCAELKEDLFEPYDFKLFKAETDRYRNKITGARKALEEQQRKEQSYDGALKELEHSKKDREDARREQEKAENLFAETKEEFIENVYTWEKGNALLKISHDQMPHIARAVQAYGVDTTYDDIKSEARRHFVTVESAINRHILEHETIRKSYEDARQNKQRELEEWKAKKDPEPERAAKVETNRKMLEAAGIPFIPFYKAVDFRQEVAAPARGRIEEALADMGLLDALIIPQGYMPMLPAVSEDAGDRYIASNPQFFKQELSMLLKPVVPKDGAITFEDIDNVLKSILIDNESSSTYVNERGEYCIGLIQGKTAQLSTPRFLGIEARKLYRQQIIDALVQEISQIKIAIDEQDAIIAEWKQKAKLLEKEFEAFPGRGDLETAFSTLDEAIKTLQVRENEVARRQLESDKLYAELKSARDKVRELTYGLQIPLTLEDFEQAESIAGIYKDKLAELETQHSRLLGTVHSISVHQDQKEEVLGDIDAIWEDLRSIKRDIDAANHKRYNLEEVLKQTDYEAIKAEVEKCIQGLNEIPLKLEAAIRSSQQNKGLHETAVKDLESLLCQIEAYERLVSAAMDSFRMEYALGYVVKYEGLEAPLAIAQKVLAELKAEEKGIRLRDEFTSSLHDRYRENMQYLVEYNLRIDTIFDEGLDNVDEAVSRIMAQRRRIELIAKVQGRDVDFYTMADFIEQSIEENDKLLKESDRQLFEDILANTVGRKIRAKIYHSEQWVRKINALMESMDTSSGLSFSLSWKKKIAESEEQLDTRDLVELLQHDAVLLTEEDMGRLTSHFRSKIAQARKSVEDTGSTQSFHTIMKEILDYRKWFEFQLFYKKTGENRKELTDNAFFKFSGGEKAMAMYVPLFSSVYARFDSAPRKDCPRLISLDEAFAGVDDNNIADMFRLVEELKLDFIINSQVLWGDYDTVPSLSIYELIRPNNVDFVTTIRYLWNGRVRKLVE